MTVITSKENTGLKVRCPAALQQRLCCRLYVSAVEGSGRFAGSLQPLSLQGQGARMTMSDHGFAAYLFSSGALWDIVKFTLHPYAVL